MIAPGGVPGVSSMSECCEFVPGKDIFFPQDRVILFQLIADPDPVIP